MDDDAPAFAPAKLRPPKFELERLERPRLAAALRSITSHALTLVTAPAGSGKTLGVATWAAMAEVPVAWLRLDPADHTPNRLVALVLAAVAVARPELGTPTWPGHEPISIESWLTRRLLIPLAEQGGSLVIVLDEAEVAPNGTLAIMLAWLLDNRDAGLHLCVIGREPPALPLARVEARGELLRVGVDQLWFREAELRAGRCGAPFELSRGWPIAVRLLEQAAGEGRVIPRQVANHRVLAFVIEEVLDRLEPELRGVLIDTAILDELELDACVAVSGRADAGEQLCAAFDSGLLYGARDSLRAHPLLREALLARLGLEGRERSLHRRASRFYAAHGRIDAALSHGVAAGDVDGLAQLACERGWTLLRAGQLDALAGLLAAVDEAGPSDALTPEQRSTLAVLRAWSTLRGDLPSTAGALEQARRALSAKDELLSRSLDALQALVELRGGEAARGLARAEAALSGLGVEQRGLRVVLRLAIALASELGHDLRGALEALARASLDAAIAPALPSLASIAAHRVRLLRKLARAGEALELGEAVAAKLVELGCDQAPAAGALALELAMVELERGDFEQAERTVLRGLGLVELGGDAAAHVRGLIALTRIRRARGDVEGVSQALERARVRCRAAQLPHLAVLVGIEQRPLTPWEHRLEGLGPLGELLRTELRLARAAAWLREPGSGSGRIGEVIAELELELEAAEAEGRRLVALQARVLLAALLPARERARAEALLHEAVAIAEPEQLRAPFLAAREQLVGFGASLPSWLADLLRPAPSSPVSAPEPPLSERELELLGEIARGLSNQLIARTLHISLATVKTHVHHILTKLEVRNRTEAVHRARSLGLID
ncbi:MAG: LuxR C-terminal-related transcriptional regulator [Enhygromyxa sp.]